MLFGIIIHAYFENYAMSTNTLQTNAAFLNNAVRNAQIYVRPRPEGLNSSHIHEMNIFNYSTVFLHISIRKLKYLRAQNAMIDN
jgi:hypothetical protein